MCALYECVHRICRPYVCMYTSKLVIVFASIYVCMYTPVHFLLGLASLELLYSGSNHIYLLGHSLSKPLTTPHNPSHSLWGSSRLRPGSTPLHSIHHTVNSSNRVHHLYVDDTQLFISFLPASFSTSIAHLLSVVNQISQWMPSNLLCINPST